MDPTDLLCPSTQVKRTNLKKPDSERTGHGLRVKFNPLALLLDASLEGEFDLVQRIIYEVLSGCARGSQSSSAVSNMSPSAMSDTLVIVSHVRHLSHLQPCWSS